MFHLPSSGAKALWSRIYADLRSRRLQSASICIVIIFTTIFISLGWLIFSSVSPEFL
jgi:D-alanyl-lipoteichoic acid acyltransferase DltB (MBOAT superfamily)